MSDLVGTIEQVAEALETSDDSVRWLKKNAGLPHVYINRKEWVVPWAALNRWLDDQVAANTLDLPAPVAPEAQAAVNGGLTYTVHEAAAALGISSWSYYAGIERGELPAIRLTPRRVVVPKFALDQFLLAAAKPSTLDHAPEST